MKSRTPRPYTHRTSRRRFIGTLGAAAGAVMVSGLKPSAGFAAPAAQANPEEQFGRMFNLPPFAPQAPRIEAALMELGQAGGILDARDQLSAGPAALITDPSLNLVNRNNPTHTAGTTFMGQFMDHDMTFDTTSRLGKPTPPQHTNNVRTPWFDLDSVYGGGPSVNPELYVQADPVKFKVESGGLFEDLPRTPDMRAIIADPRNDENVILAGLHAAVLLFHNKAVDGLRATNANPSEMFTRARQLTTWHYQWLILHEFLPLFIGQSMVNDILARGRKFYTPKRGAFIPVEFQGAVYRFGHSMVRPSYRANMEGQNGGPFFGLIFDPAEFGKPDPNDLLGGARAPRRFVGWQTFFNFNDGEVRPNKLIDTKLSTPLFNLPPGAIAGPSAPSVLPQRTLLRHLTWKLPSGQRIAQEMGLTPVPTPELKPFGFEDSAPLFYYVLKEAQELGNGGQRLGPVGGRITGEVILGLLQMDPNGYLTRNPTWTPTLQNPGSGFRMVDFLRFAGVDPASRGQ